ncbi:MAG: MBG domain-containing protein, partial [Balneola sp.]
MKTYGEENPTLEVVYSGFKNEDEETVLTTAPSPSTTATSASAAGEYPISLSNGSDDNYTISNVSGTLTVNKSTLSASAPDQSREYGEPNPALSVEVTGFVNGEDVNVLAAPPAATTEASTASNVGT